MAEATKLYRIDKAATQWRDLSESDIKKEKAVKISLIVLGILLTAATVYVIYILATTPDSSHWCDTCKVIHVDSVKGLIAIPVLLGGIGTTLSFGWGIALSFEKSRYGFPKNLSTHAARHEVKLLLSKGELKDVYAQYYNKNGGLGPLVRQGYMTPKQGTELRTILNDYNRVQVENVRLQSRPLIKKAIEENQPSVEYF